MEKRFQLTFILLAFVCGSFCQSPQTPKVFTSDIDHFWQAYDSVLTVKDSSKRLDFIQRLYIDRGTEGLKSFMELRNYSGPLWVSLITRYPKFWASIRSNTLSAKTKSTQIEKSITRFQQLYPELKEAKMYFTVGGLRSGGTTTGDKVLIGTEIATGDSSTDVSEFKSKWLAGVFKERSAENLVPLNIQEYVHTQQHGEATDLLAQAIQEGSADFITELVLDTSRQTNYIKYGLAHEEELKEKFKEDMFSDAYSRWLYNGSNAETVADLGYFMGYAICKSYYQKAENKTTAIKKIIELNYSDSIVVESFLVSSGYYREQLNKKDLIARFEMKQPRVVSSLPFITGDTAVDPADTALTIVFSAPMKKGAYSINFGAGGKSTYPITKSPVYADDGKSIRLAIELKPHSRYEFILTNRSFASSDGYPLVEYPVSFQTK
jgi:hypothetical protein